MKNLTPYNFHSQEVRAFLKDGEPWFVAKDLCDVLEIGNPSQAISRLDDDEKNTIILNDGTPGNPSTVIVSEPGMYQLVLGSRKPIAKEFKRWLCHEVIPSVRKTGSYSIDKTPIQILAETTAYMVEMEKIQMEHSKAIGDLQSDVSQLASEVDRFKDGDGHFMSVLGFANINGRTVSRTEAKTLGKQASKLCREQGIEPEKVSDGRFGSVNAYPQSILRQVFGL
jgi:prophage antirepressor-like protein